MAEGWEGNFTHFGEQAAAEFWRLANHDESLRAGRLTDIEVEVPPNQTSLPAGFVAAARIPFDGGTAAVFASFERAATGEPWLATALGWWADGSPGTPTVDVDGWLLPLPEPDKLAVDPEDLPARYADWLDRSWEVWLNHSRDLPDVVADDLFVLRSPEDSYFLSRFDAAATGVDRSRFSVSQETRPEPGALVVPLADGSVLALFTVAVHTVAYNRPDYASGSCGAGDVRSWGFEGATVAYRELAGDYRVQVLAWVPAAEPGLDP